MLVIGRIIYILFLIAASTILVSRFKALFRNLRKYTWFFIDPRLVYTINAHF